MVSIYRQEAELLNQAQVGSVQLILIEGVSLKISVILILAIFLTITTASYKHYKMSTNPTQRSHL